MVFKVLPNDFPIRAYSNYPLSELAHYKLYALSNFRRLASMYHNRE